MGRYFVLQDEVDPPPVLLRTKHAWSTSSCKTKYLPAYGHNTAGIAVWAHQHII